MDPFEISVDIRRRQLDMSLRGFWDLATFERFAAEFVRALHLLHRHGGLERALVDGSAFAVQSREVMMRFAEVTRENAAYLARRTANVVPGALNRLQVSQVGQRIASRDFKTRAEAQAWLAQDLVEAGEGG